MHACRAALKQHLQMSADTARSCAGPWPQLLDAGLLPDLTLGEEVGAWRSTFRRSTTSMAEVAARLRAERRARGAAAGSLPTLGASFGASLGGSLGASLGDKLSASQFDTGALGACAPYLASLHVCTLMLGNSKG